MNEEDITETIKGWIDDNDLNISASEIEELTWAIYGLSDIEMYQTGFTLGCSRKSEAEERLEAKIKKLEDEIFALENPDYMRNKNKFVIETTWGYKKGEVIPMGSRLAPK